MRAFLKFMSVVGMALLAVSCGGDGGDGSEDAASEQRLVEYESSKISLACDGWGFSDVVSDPSTPAKAIFYEDSVVISQVGGRITNYGEDDTHHYYSAEDGLELDYVVCFREAGRTPVDVSCPLEILGEVVEPATFELDIEVFVVEASTGAEVGGGIVNAPFTDCPRSASVDRDNPEIFGSFDEEEVLALVKPIFEG